MNLLIKKTGVLFFLFFTGISIAKAEDLTLDEESQISICIQSTNSLTGLKICINENTPPERVAVCVLYTSSIVAESLCLKNKSSRTQITLNCFLNTESILEEQACLVYPDSYDSVMMNISNFETYSNTVKDMKNELEALLGFRLNFNTTLSEFELIEEDNLEEFNLEELIGNQLEEDNLEEFNLEEFIGNQLEEDIILPLML